ncbi:hypothetical protein RI543_004469 [Arxiozyma heterogenica]|uniref:DNA polymerase epsilon catalytic subunit n=1 Tax=Arxiozyma heterogenica TaxID=278026 RepID=A0AAN8A661_9SACH|nr:hypothetical protein RI543_004469 [Kazachstania heterogenica]
MSAPRKPISSSARMLRRDMPGTSTYALDTQQLIQSNKIDEIDSMMGFERYIPPEEAIVTTRRSQFSKLNNKQTSINYNSAAQINALDMEGRVGWLINMHPVVVSMDTVASSNSVDNSITRKGRDGNLLSFAVAGVDFYFLDEEGGSFKSTLTYDPYFFITVTDDSMVSEVEEYLKKLLESCLKSITVVTKEDLSMDNHLLGLKKTLIKLSFVNNNQLFEARKILRPILLDNQNTMQQRNIYSNQHNQNSGPFDARRFIEDIREYDVPYHVRVSIDKNIRVGKWYKVLSQGFLECVEKVAFADPVVLAFDIETTKAPLKFPDANIDQIMMISYMIDGEGFLITNREIISEDIEDFEYTPKPEYQGMFTIFNEPDELALLNKFFDHIRDVRPTVISTFNGDFFDWPFVETRAKIHGLSMFDEIGFAPDSEGEYKSSYCSHMDCFRWVKRDSYLPQGSQGLKAVTQAKLGYNPIELDPELMTPYAYERPQQLSEYSVSDAVATYYLYMKYVHPFIFSLCTIIPLNPDEVLRKGTGTLCEMLLMVQAYQNNILLPNKHTDPIERFYDGHLLESETYVGGHVESLEAGVFRSDLKSKFKIDPTVIDELLEDLPHALKFCIETENKSSMEDVTNYEEIRQDIMDKLLDLKNNKKREEYPLIYHVDVASMYPNIMTTNRLQPDSIKTERDCASCDFNRPGKTCARRLKWAWRGEFYPAKMDEYNMIKRALQNETFPNKNKYSPKQYLTFDELSYAEQMSHIKKRLNEYCRKNYNRIKSSEVVEREAIVCQRENPFYVNTVRSFRDRRYEFKGLAKTWKGKMAKIDSHDKHAKDEAKKMVVLYDSLQLAHKVILNSFYGYVMRKGSRWYSMEMAGITCLTGATIIQMARSVVERVGRPLELDTDGIWCILPKSFPENYFFKLKNGKKLFLSYPCSMLNYKVHQRFTNHQYQELIDPIKHKYKTHSENSIFFEVDGPYKAMILPTSKEEGKGIKKRYAVFNEDGSLAELKGFELKRRGELQLIKNFQSDIFKLFLEGDSLESCYAAVANVANRWLDVLDTKGAMLEDEDLIELICENRSMSKTLQEYEGQKSTSITTAKRIGEFLGPDMVKDKGLQCRYIISHKPADAPVTERAIPVAIFSAEISVKRSFLRRWTLDHSLDNFDIRYIIDWAYYRERLASTIQKIITIPAALQDVDNPVPRVEHPDWLKKKIHVRNDKYKQTSLSKFFNKADEAPESGKIKDIEDLFRSNDTDHQDIKKKSVARVIVTKTQKRKNMHESGDEALVLPSVMPSMEEDYQSWLEYQKIKWKIQARDRKRKTQLFGNINNKSYRSALGSMVRKQAEIYANSTWEVLQYKQSTEPGKLDVYVLINGKIQVLNFKIPKTIYIKCKSGNLPLDKLKNCLVEKSNAILPNNPNIPNGSMNLFKVTLPETVFMEEMEACGSILNGENVLGVFESSISTVNRAIIELGSSVVFKSNIMGSLGKGLQNGFDMKNLNMVPNERYMSKFSNDFVFILHCATNIGYEFFVVSELWDDSVTIFTLKPSIQALELNQVTLTKIFKKAFELRKSKIQQYSKISNLSDKVVFDVKNYTDIDKLTRHLTQQIGKIKEEKGQQFITLVQSPFCDTLIRNVKYLRTLPVISISSRELQLPQLNWQVKLCTSIVGQLLSCSSRISQMIKVAQYSNIPVCNIQLNDINSVIDILYARKLKHENIVLWWNENGPLPDIGGFEKNYDETLSSMMGDLTFPQINSPNIYDQTVLEVSVRNLTINTVMVSSLITEAEGIDLANVDMVLSDEVNGDSSNFVQDSFGSDALNVLKNTVKTWWDEALEDNFTADLLVNSFINWVQNPYSKLFDCVLRYHIHNLTQKTILQLINEFDSLGSSVIYADRNKILIKTKKYSPENCYAYSQYIMKAVKANPVFKYLDLQIEKYWDILIWMDKYNFGGLACLQIEAKDKQDMDAYSNWQISSALPAIYRTEFDDWMVIILDSLLKTKENYLESNISTQRVTQLIPQNLMQVKKKKKNDDGLDDSQCIFADFTKYFAKPLIKRINKLYKNQKEFILDPVYSQDYQFPQLPGSYLNMKNPLLEFVKSICEVMLLGTNTTLEVRQLRKDLLKIFEVREFAKVAEFKNPSMSLEINGFMCEYCSYLSDIDFCKQNWDSNATDDTNSGNRGPDLNIHNRLNSFRCKKCSKEYDITLLQERLVYKLLRDFYDYGSQDLYCMKCHRIREDFMSPHCTCSGDWAGKITQNEFTQKLKVYRQVAQYYEFNYLEAALNEIQS